MRGSHPESMQGGDLAMQIDEYISLAEMEYQVLNAPVISLFLGIFAPTLLLLISCP